LGYTGILETIVSFNQRNKILQLGAVAVEKVKGRLRLKTLKMKGLKVTSLGGVTKENKKGRSARYVIYLNSRRNR